ncbi:MAG TPA: hypothetical protein VGK77_01000, partial [Candidatus Binatia bacterium]
CSLSRDFVSVRPLMADTLLQLLENLGDGETRRLLPRRVLLERSQKPLNSVRYVMRRRQGRGSGATEKSLVPLSISRDET